MLPKIVEDRGLVLMGCGKMGSAILQGWLAQGLAPSQVWIVDPKPSDWLQSTGVHINEMLPDNPAVVLVAVKPQVMAEALPRIQTLGSGTTLFLAVAAGTSLATYEEALGRSTPIVRCMPNTPAAIGQGVSALIGNGRVTERDMETAEALMSAVGQTVRLDDENQMDAVTALSGSGPAYVFHLIETLAAAGVAQGLPDEMAMHLAKATVAGAGALALQADEAPDQLRVNVTSPNG
ncbi:MAG: pyrroline-5-carboxylate reductase, partial [Pseudomonadota bacterium]